MDLMSVKLDQIVVSDKFKHGDVGFKYFIGYHRVKLLNCYALSYLKWMNTLNTLKTVAKTFLFWLKMMKCGKNANKFGMWLKIN